MCYWFSCDAATVSIRANTNMAQRKDSPDGAAELLISSPLSSPGPQIGSLAFRLVISLTTAAVSSPEGGLTRGLLPNPSNPINPDPDSPYIKTLLCGDAVVVHNPAVCNTKSALRQRLGMSVTIKKCNAISKGRKKKNPHVIKWRGECLLR